MSRQAEAPAQSHDLPQAFRDLTVTQIGILVPDLVAAVKTYRSILDQETWSVFTYSREVIPNLTYRGAPAEFSIRLALAGSGPQIELIQPQAGQSVYSEWIEERGFGVQHLGFHVPRLAPVAAQLAQEGWEPVQSGSGYGVDGDGGFAYYDTVDELGLMLEVIEIPATRIPSETLEPVVHTN